MIPDETTYYVPLADLVKLRAEIDRLKAELAKEKETTLRFVDRRNEALAEITRLRAIIADAQRQVDEHIRIVGDEAIAANEVSVGGKFISYQFVHADDTKYAFGDALVKLAQTLLAATEGTG